MAFHVLCDQCDAELASVFCHSDGAFLCQRCDTQVHSVNKIAQRHLRVAYLSCPVWAYREAKSRGRLKEPDDFLPNPNSKLDAFESAAALWNNLGNAAAGVSSNPAQHALQLDQHSAQGGGSAPSIGAVAPGSPPDVSMSSSLSAQPQISQAPLSRSASAAVLPLNLSSENLFSASIANVAEAYPGAPAPAPPICTSDESRDLPPPLESLLAPACLQHGEAGLEAGPAGYTSQPQQAAQHFPTAPMPIPGRAEVPQFPMPLARTAPIDIAMGGRRAATLPIASDPGYLTRLSASHGSGDEWTSLHKSLSQLTPDSNNNLCSLSNSFGYSSMGNGAMSGLNPANSMEDSVLSRALQLQQLQQQYRMAVGSPMQSVGNHHAPAVHGVNEQPDVCMSCPGQQRLPDSKMLHTATPTAAGATNRGKTPFYEAQLITRMERPDGTFKEVDPERAAQLYRYRHKRMLRLRAFAEGQKKIRYECRKVLADSRPRVKGRFAKVKSSDDLTQTADSNANAFSASLRPQRIDEEQQPAGQQGQQQQQQQQPGQQQQQMPMPMPMLHQVQPDRQAFRRALSCTDVNDNSLASFNFCLGLAPPIATDAELASLVFDDFTHATPSSFNTHMDMHVEDSAESMSTHDSRNSAATGHRSRSRAQQGAKEAPRQCSEPLPTDLFANEQVACMIDALLHDAYVPGMFA